MTPQEKWLEKLRANIYQELSSHPKFVLYEIGSPEMEEYIMTIAAIVGGRMLSEKLHGGDVFFYFERIALVREEICLLKERKEN